MELFDLVFCLCFLWLARTSVLFPPNYLVLVIGDKEAEEEEVLAFPGNTPLSPIDLAQFGRHLISEVETRAVQSIETGTLVSHSEWGVL